MCSVLQRGVPSRIVVLASGNGSNFEAIVNAVRSGELSAKIEMLLVDRDCYAIERAKRLKVPWEKLEKSWAESLKKRLEELNPDLVVLAGFMRILPAEIVERWKWKIVNIHPSLLPAFPGTHAIEKAYEYGVKVTGITIHFVDEGVDTGPIIFQKAIEIKKDWTLERLEEEIHKIEHQYYPLVIQKVLEGRWNIEGRRVILEEDIG
ncbi:phosphoribosylglycinamide formyltransferase [Thermotoga sp. 38H-to]|uniref:phosphoribosylglycinamide formyltransferase n=1 Tax=Thermotoga sp. 38H-to TaxID=1755812 RepID=UPI0013EB86EC|nr:phosphoribosylglycinamide formyltransferase [Thermotoga sp. 38H-to]KAF2960228.1 phosphoribosylglycinamide formyltransferase [Thermotoga sp. 38H-to]